MAYSLTTKKRVGEDLKSGMSVSDVMNKYGLSKSTVKSYRNLAGITVYKHCESDRVGKEKDGLIEKVGVLRDVQWYKNKIKDSCDMKRRGMGMTVKQFDKWLTGPGGIQFLKGITS